MSVKHDKYKQVRLLPETVKRIEEFRHKNPLAPSVPKLVNYYVLLGLNKGVK